MKHRSPFENSGHHVNAVTYKVVGIFKKSQEKNTEELIDKMKNLILTEKMNSFAE